MYCSNCGKPVEDTAKFCKNCGQPVGHGTYCSNCGAQNNSLAEICINCGARLAQLQSTSPPTAPQYTPPAPQQAKPKASKQPVVPPAVNTTDKSKKSRVFAAILALLLGQLGLHRFYAGKKRTGAVQLLLTVAGYVTVIFSVIGYAVLGIMGAWVLIDFILILAGKFKDGKGLHIR
jgi:TM2 domain-containing membrane protein YozV/DNA-directed RNA polymerase subunit RPC12/RpoP